MNINNPLYPIVSFLPLVIISTIVYFLIIAPQRKKGKSSKDIFKSSKKNKSFLDSEGHSNLYAICYKCHSVLDDDVFCENCGIRIKCSNCGSPISSETNFCPNCGKELK